MYIYSKNSDSVYQIVSRLAAIRVSTSRRLKVAAIVTLLAAIAGPAYRVSAAEPVYMNQGAEWTTVSRADFYTRDQGSRLIPYAWLMALTQPNGQPFLGDDLSRYGYLPNPGNPDGLPVGFTKNGKYAGLNCAACHTRQINVDGQEYRIDGGPAIVDAQGLFSGLDEAVSRVLATDASFLAFAKKVFGRPNPTPDEIVHLKEQVEAWFLRYDTQMKRGLPTNAWGPGRMDAVGMIFNRLTGLDIGPPPSYIIADNIQRADAPVRYPFLWNAAIQDWTQWPGFAANGSDLLGLARNLGEVYGVFADFFPHDDLLVVDYLRHNSANFDGLQRLETLIKKLGPPKYPWPIDEKLKAQGQILYEQHCNECHGKKPGTVRFFENQTWATPRIDVGTDSREHQILLWTAKTGVLQGEFIPLVVDPLKPTDSSFKILTLSVVGTIIQQKTIGILPAQARQIANKTDDDLRRIKSQIEKARASFKLPPDLQDLKGAFQLPGKGAVPENGKQATGYVYESRVLEGIWATAPYLHNGSVPTLADLLEPASKRPRKFKIGPNYDINRVGLAQEQTKFGDQILVSDPNDRNSGNSNCGHEYGTGLTSQEKKALLEYLKAL